MICRKMAAISAWISASVFSFGAAAAGGSSVGGVGVFSFSWLLGLVEGLDLEDLEVLDLANIWTCGLEERGEELG